MAECRKIIIRIASLALKKIIICPIYEYREIDGGESCYAS